MAHRKMARVGSDDRLFQNFLLYFQHILQKITYYVQERYILGFMEYFFCSARLYVYLLCVSKGGPLVAMWWPTGAYYVGPVGHSDPCDKSIPCVDISIHKNIKLRYSNRPGPALCIYTYQILKYLISEVHWSYP